MIQDWTVLAYREGKTKPNKYQPGENLTAFYVDFMGADETKQDGVYWQRKEGNVPPVNESVFGEITEGDYGPRFKMAQREGAAPAQGAPFPPIQQQQAPQQPRPDAERQRRIERQHSQEMALRLIDASRDAGDLDLTNHDLTAAYLNEVVRKLTDWFAKDLEAR